jgi:dihydroorotase/N-acyl-D-amino-acid deacylase
MAGGDSAFVRRLDTPDTARRILAETLENLRTDRGAGDIARVQFARVAWQPDLEGRTLADWARMLGRAPTLETGAELVLEAARRGGASAIFHAMDEGDIDRIMRHPQTMIASDGRPTEPGIAHPHPRWYGTFPRVLARYVRERHVLTLEQAIHKMTAMPAARLGLPDRGRVAEGACADLVVFDPATIADRATFEAPHQYPAGIDAVIVNGVVAVDGNGFTGARPGHVLRHRASP